MVGFVSRGLGEPGALSGEVGFVMFALFWSPRLSCLSLPLLLVWFRICNVCFALVSPALLLLSSLAFGVPGALGCLVWVSPALLLLSSLAVLDAWLQKRYI